MSGLGVSGGRTRGRVRIIDDNTIDDLQPGEVIVAEVTDVGYTPAFQIAAAVVTNLGGALSHAAIVAREFGGSIQPPATKGFDVRTDAGTRIQVKSLRVSSSSPV